MRRFWLSQKNLDNEFHIDGEAYHHICQVCRMQEGSIFEILNGDEKSYVVRLEKRNKNFALAKVIDERSLPVLKKPYLHLCLSFPKVKTFEAVVEKSVELGVKSIYPFSSDFSFTKKLDEILEKKTGRWQKIITGASQQSGRADRMSLEKSMSLDALLQVCQQRPRSLLLFAYEGEGERSLKDQLKAMPQGIENIFLFVGSEGGFSDREVEIFQGLESPPLSLGDQVLRVETACVALLSSIKYELDL